ncbi:MULTISPECIES: META domain-containing protein [Streptomyces]|uniref:META domain-containing protein n=1 Tax=Streptomyces TaxID=1883 RepID=UPI0012927FEC|nr:MULTISPECIES: META domain-containing protein [Streptomyces]MCX5036832.1 META domain-containing protein [Streptomyces coelicoflavus]QFX83038.1 META domain-containing protein [Streptomyces sp. SYP-A7193]
MYRQKRKYESRKKQQRSMTLTVAAVAALVPLAAACGSEQADDAGSDRVGAGGQRVTGVRWSIDSVTVDGTTHRAPDTAHVRIDDGGRAAGSTGCNSFSARADVQDEGDGDGDGRRVRLSDAMFTEKACAKTPAGFEKSLGRALTTGPLTTKGEGERLTLTTADGDTVRLSRFEDVSLHGTEWVVDTPGQKGEKGRAVLTFDQDAETVSGRLPCNRVNAAATVSDGRITLGAPSTTRMMCEGSLMDAEKRLLGLFDSKVTYRIDQQTLTLTSEDGVTVRAAAAQ